ncbi:hypothetical protein Y032_0199g1649 [Ancylostoma ceylanicum]|uniref:Uncharacterized protein n=1 Tax=Ancylostoma ceylanicum TaxID=53326 RepID=A0A016SNN8_9BILA|nr:hypothetical protein Y032_0199g1649 [Ancylostoma ceylanicum]
MIHCHGYIQYIKGTTRDSSTLDLLFANSTELIDNVSLCAPVGTSDRMSITFNILGGRIDLLPIRRRSFTKCDYEAINAYLANVNWINSFESVSSVNDKYNMFIDILHHVVDIFVPWIYVFPQASLAHNGNADAKMVNGCDVGRQSSE